MAAVWCFLEIMDLDICLLTLHLRNFYDKSLVMSEHYTLWGLSQFPWCWSMKVVSFVVLYPDSSLSFLHLDTGLCAAAQVCWLEQHRISTQMTKLAVLSSNHTSFSIKVAKRAGNPRLSECPIKHEDSTVPGSVQGMIWFLAGLTAVASNQTILVFRKFYFWKQEKFKQPQKFMLWYFHGKNYF